MTIEILVLLVFVAVTAGIVGLWMLIAARSQVKRERFIETRLQERFVESLATETIRRTGDCGPR